MKSRATTFRAGSIAALTVFAAGAAAGQAGGFRTVALSGQQAAGFDAGVTYSSLFTTVGGVSVRDIQLNDAGHTAFAATLTGAGIDSTNDTALFSGGAGSGLGVVLQTGTPTQGLASGVHVASFGDPILNGNGQTALTVTLSGAGIDDTNSSAILRERRHSGLSLVVQEGDQAAGLAAGIQYEWFPHLAFDDTERTGFAARLRGSGIAGPENDTAIYTQGGGSGLSLIGQTGMQVSDPSDGAKYIYFGGPVLNNAGQTAFLAGHVDGPYAGAFDRIYVDGKGPERTVVAQTGTQVADLAAGVSYGSFGGPTLNDAGYTAFQGRLTGDGVNDSNDSAIFSEGSGSGVSVIAREGDQAAGLATGVKHGEFLGRVNLNNAGQTAFWSLLTGNGIDSPYHQAIFSEGGGSGLVPVVQTGTQAAGLAAGVNYEAFGYRAPVLNDLGQLAFFAILSGVGVDSTNDRAIFATDLLGDVLLVAAEGELFNVSSDPLVDDLRTIDSFGSFEFNNSGELAFNALFTDGSSGIFVATIPAPWGIGVLGLATLFAGRRRG